MTHAKLQVGTTLERTTSAQYAARCPDCGWTQPARSLAGAGLATVAHYLEFPSHTGWAIKPLDDGDPLGGVLDVRRLRFEPRRAARRARASARKAV
jgi:hypothetical protein